jgi:hypothetical protein
MPETPHPAVLARRQRLHKIRVRVATGAVALFVAVFSVIYTQMPASAQSTTAQKKAAGDTSSGSVASSTNSQPTSVTTSQS